MTLIIAGVTLLASGCRTINFREPTNNIDLKRFNEWYYPPEYLNRPEGINPPAPLKDYRRITPPMPSRELLPPENEGPNRNSTPPSRTRRSRVEFV